MELHVHAGRCWKLSQLSHQSSWISGYLFTTRGNSQSPVPWGSGAPSPSNCSWKAPDSRTDHIPSWEESVSDLTMSHPTVADEHSQIFTGSFNSILSHNLTQFENRVWQSDFELASWKKKLTRNRGWHCGALENKHTLTRHTFSDAKRAAPTGNERSERRPRTNDMP